MAQSVVTRRDGDVFQARLFWLRAAPLLDQDGLVARVGFESGQKGFDDIWVEYDPNKARPDQFGHPLQIERMQCKWHAQPGEFGYQDLIDPAYINATSTSLLQRARDAYRADISTGIVSRLTLVTTHQLSSSDVLYACLRNKSYTLDLDKLFAGKTARSADGKLRKAWREHLQVDDDELRQLCARLSLKIMRTSLDRLWEKLDDACNRYGLRRPDPRASSTIYDANVFEWVGQRRYCFDRQEFREKCAQEGLLAERPIVIPAYGIKTFEHQLDRLEDRCVATLDLVPEFDDRQVRDAQAWRHTLLPALKQFLRGAQPTAGRLRLAIEAHATIAFAAGTILDTKSGRVVDLEQRSPILKLWAPDDASMSPDWPGWEYEEIAVNPTGQGMAWALSITHDTQAAVRSYLQADGPDVKRLIVARLTGGPSQRAVVSGAHADQLAQSLAARIKQERETSPDPAQERCHLFIAAPNTFTFHLGRRVALLKPVTLYEFDFDFASDGSYQPSLLFPEIEPVAAAGIAP